jgi:hypothetical protein
MGNVWGSAGTNMNMNMSTPPGCALPLAELEARWPGIVVEPIEEQAKVADAVCRAGATDPVFCKRQLGFVRSAFPHGAPDNATGVGNLAWLALHAEPAAVREEFKVVHLAYTAHLALRHKVKPLTTAVARGQ